MLTTLRTPRWLGRLAALLVLLAAFTWLGFWQLGVAYDKGRVKAQVEAAQQRPVPLPDLIRPHQPFPAGGMNRPVTLSGTYEPEHQLLVPGRRLDGAEGYWVLAPVVVEGTGARLAVVRGFVADPAQATPPGRGRVDLAGTLGQPEGAPERVDLPEGQIGSVDPGSLVNAWGGEIYNAFVFAQAETPDQNAGTQIRRVPPPRVEHVSVNWRNFFYALQWWAFGVLAVYVFVRVLREEHTGVR